MSKKAFCHIAWRVAFLVLLFMSSHQAASAGLPAEAVQLQIFNILEVPSPNSVLIAWETSLPATSMAEYGMTQSLGMPPHFSANLTTRHTANLEGLKPNQTYFYRVTSETAEGEAAAEPDIPRAFRTTPDTGAAPHKLQASGETMKPAAKTSKVSIEINAEDTTNKFRPALRITSQKCTMHHAPNLLEIAKPLGIQTVTCCNQDESAASSAEGYEARLQANISSSYWAWAAKLEQPAAASYESYAGASETAIGNSHIEALRAINVLAKAAYYGIKATTSQPIYGTEQETPAVKTQFIQPAYYAALLYSKWFGTEMVKSSADAKNKDVSLWASRDAGKPEELRLILVNLGSQAVDASIQITGFTPKSGKYYEMASPEPFSSRLTAVNGFRVDADYRRALPSIESIKAKALTEIEHKPAESLVKYSSQPYTATAIILSSTDTSETTKVKAGAPKPLNRPVANGKPITLAAMIASSGKNLTKIRIADVSLAGPTKWHCAKNIRLKQPTTAEEPAYILFDVPAPILTIASISSNSTAYSADFTITSQNRLFNIGASLNINASYSNWKLYALDGTEWADITSLSSLTVSGNKAVFSGFSAYYQQFRIEGQMANSSECPGKGSQCLQPNAAQPGSPAITPVGLKQFVVTVARQERPLTGEPQTIKASPLRRIEGKVEIELITPDEVEAGEQYEVKVKLLSPLKGIYTLTIAGQNLQVSLEAGTKSEVSLTLRAPEAKGRFVLEASVGGSLATKAIMIIYKPLFLYVEAAKYKNSAQVNITVKNYEDMLTELTIIRNANQKVFSKTIDGAKEFNGTFTLNYPGKYRILAKAFSKENLKKAAESDEYTLTVETENPSRPANSAAVGFVATLAGILALFGLMIPKIRQRL